MNYNKFQSHSSTPMTINFHESHLSSGRIEINLFKPNEISCDNNDGCFLEIKEYEIKPPTQEIQNEDHLNSSNRFPSDDFEKKIAKTTNDNHHIKQSWSFRNHPTTKPVITTVAESIRISSFSIVAPKVSIDSSLQADSSFDNKALNNQNIGSHERCFGQDSESSTPLASSREMGGHCISRDTESDMSIVHGSTREISYNARYKYENYGLDEEIRNHKFSINEHSLFQPPKRFFNQNLQIASESLKENFKPDDEKRTSGEFSDIVDLRGCMGSTNMSASTSNMPKNEPKPIEGEVIPCEEWASCEASYTFHPFPEIYAANIENSNNLTPVSSGQKKKIPPTIPVQKGETKPTEKKTPIAYLCEPFLCSNKDSRTLNNDDTISIQEKYPIKDFKRYAKDLNLSKNEIREIRPDAAHMFTNRGRQDLLGVPEVTDTVSKGGEARTAPPSNRDKIRAASPLRPPISKIVKEDQKLIYNKSLSKNNDYDDKQAVLKIKSNISTENISISALSPTKNNKSTGTRPPRDDGRSTADRGRLADQQFILRVDSVESESGASMSVDVRIVSGEHISSADQTQIARRENTRENSRENSRENTRGNTRESVKSPVGRMARSNSNESISLQVDVKSVSTQDNYALSVSVDIRNDDDDRGKRKEQSMIDNAYKKILGITIDAIIDESIILLTSHGPKSKSKAKETRPRMSNCVNTVPKERIDTCNAGMVKKIPYKCVGQRDDYYRDQPFKPIDMFCPCHMTNNRLSKSDYNLNGDTHQKLGSANERVGKTPEIKRSNSSVGDRRSNGAPSPTARCYPQMNARSHETLYIHRSLFCEPFRRHHDDPIMLPYGYMKQDICHGATIKRCESQQPSDMNGHKYVKKCDYFARQIKDILNCSACQTAIHHDNRSQHVNHCFNNSNNKNQLVVTIQETKSTTTDSTEEGSLKKNIQQFYHKSRQLKNKLFYKAGHRK